MAFSALKNSMVFSVPQTHELYGTYCKEFWQEMPSSWRACLKQLVEAGPVWDGDIVSKAARGDLLRLKLASRACVKGEQGFTVANYVGWDILKAGTLGNENSLC